jgi:hypothetical protein
MHWGKSITRREHIIIVSSSSNDDDNMSLGADQEKAPKAHVSTHDDASSSAVLQCRGDALLQWDLFTHKYEAH